ncbi:transposase [Saccharopolyspora sp. 6V]|uniref:transposase n=1 Tax=Saccharopolyspora sp. 6V TaxID=2877239 RepID=UPI001CD6E7A3|nr:transposase [Saccharopolyspora sp. 6V]
MDASHVRAKKEGSATGSSPVDRGKTGSKHHLICDGGGVPRAVTLAGGNRNYTAQLVPLADTVARVRDHRGRPLHPPKTLVADRGYDYGTYRNLLRQRVIRPVTSRRVTRDNNSLSKPWPPAPVPALDRKGGNAAPTSICGFPALARGPITCRRLPHHTR